MAKNFARGTTAADIESATTPVGGVTISCRIIAEMPSVIAEIVFETKEGADNVVNTFNNQNVSQLDKIRWLQVTFVFRPMAIFSTSITRSAALPTNKPLPDPLRSYEPLHLLAPERTLSPTDLKIPDLATAATLPEIEAETGDETTIQERT